MSETTEQWLFKALASRIGEIASTVALQEIAKQLTADPTLIEELCPGMRLIAKPMTNDQRKDLMVAASVKVRRQKVDKRVELLKPIIMAAIKTEPDISIRGIAKVLESKGFLSPRGNRWHPSSVQMVMRQAGISE